MKLLRIVIARLLWVGRLTSSLVGLVLLATLALGLGTTALAAVPGDPLRLGETNRIDALTTLVGTRAGALLQLNNKGGPALNLVVPANAPPLAVSAGAGKAPNLNADKLDGFEGSALAEPRGYAHVTYEGGIDPSFPAKGVNRVTLSETSISLYCFDLAFAPAAAVAAPHLDNAAWISTMTPRSSGTLDVTCPVGYRDAAAKTRGSDGTDAQINFMIVFV